MNEYELLKIFDSKNVLFSVQKISTLCWEAADATNPVLNEVFDVVENKVIDLTDIVMFYIEDFGYENF